MVDIALASPFQQKQFKCGTTRGCLQTNAAQRLKAAGYPAKIAARTFGYVIYGQQHRFAGPALVQKPGRFW
jgi:hypothetical protein